jgi:hypothetical protein
MDFSLLPTFDLVSKYFSFTVVGGSANVEGFKISLYNPWPTSIHPTASTKYFLLFSHCIPAFLRLDASH